MLSKKKKKGEVRERCTLVVISAIRVYIFFLNFIAFCVGLPWDITTFVLSYTGTFQGNAFGSRGVGLVFASFFCCCF